MLAFVKQNRELAKPNEHEGRPWQALFSSFYLAELAAADQARAARESFGARGDKELVAFYGEMEAEEKSHAQLVRTMFTDFIAPPKVAYDVYATHRFQLTGPAKEVERLCILHLVFEPAAMAYLSYIRAESSNIFETSWAERVSDATTSILRDEASHIRFGREIVKQEIGTLSNAERQLLIKSMRTHRSFLNVGMRTFFRDSKFQNVPAILRGRSDFSFKNAVNGVIDEAI